MSLQTVVHRSPGGTRENISWFTYIFESLRILGYTKYTIQTKTWKKTITPGGWKDIYWSFLLLTWSLPGSSTPPWFLIRWWSRTISTSTAMIFEQPFWGPVILQEAGLLHLADVSSQHPPCQDRPLESCNSKGWKLVHRPWPAMCPCQGPQNGYHTSKFPTCFSNVRVAIKLDHAQMNIPKMVWCFQQLAMVSFFSVPTWWSQSQKRRDNFEMVHRFRIALPRVPQTEIRIVKKTWTKGNYFVWIRSPQTHEKITGNHG